MAAENLISESFKFGELDETGDQKVSDHHATGVDTTSDSFIVDIQGFSHLIQKDMNAHSRITKNISRKGSFRGCETKINPNGGDQRNDSMLATSATTATLHGDNTPEKPVVVADQGPTKHSVVHHHHQITISNSGSTPAESTHGGKRSGCLRHSPPAWYIDPRRIFLFFSTLSILGTIVLIYFTLSMQLDQ